MRLSSRHMLICADNKCSARTVECRAHESDPCGNLRAIFLQLTSKSVRVQNRGVKEESLCSTTEGRAK